MTTWALWALAAPIAAVALVAFWRWKKRCDAREAEYMALAEQEWDENRERWARHEAEQEAAKRRALAKAIVDEQEARRDGAYR